MLGVLLFLQGFIHLTDVASVHPLKNLVQRIAQLFSHQMNKAVETQEGCVTQPGPQETRVKPTSPDPKIYTSVLTPQDRTEPINHPR